MGSYGKYTQEVGHANRVNKKKRAKKAREYQNMVEFVKALKRRDDDADAERVKHEQRKREKLRKALDNWRRARNGKVAKAEKFLNERIAGKTRRDHLTPDIRNRTNETMDVWKNTDRYFKGRARHVSIFDNLQYVPKYANNVGFFNHHSIPDIGQLKLWDEVIAKMKKLAGQSDFRKPGTKQDGLRKNINNAIQRVKASQDRKGKFQIKLDGDTKNYYLRELNQMLNQLPGSGNSRSSGARRKQRVQPSGGTPSAKKYYPRVRQHADAAGVPGVWQHNRVGAA